MIGPPLVGQEKELENENDDSLCVDGLPNEVSCELEVFNIHIEDLSDDSNSNDDNVETTAPPTFTLTYFFLIHTLSFSAGKRKVFVITVFLSKLDNRPLFNIYFEIILV